MGEKKLDVIRRPATQKNFTEAEKDAVRAEVMRLLEDILKNLLRHPDKTQVSMEQGERTTIFVVEVVQADFGRLLGSKGRHIEALRVLVSSLCGNHDIRGIIRIKNEDRFF